MRSLFLIQIRSLPLFLSLSFAFATQGVGSPFVHASVSLYAIDKETGEVLLDENSDLSLVPSSCMKIVTTGAALHLLDSELRFATDLEYDGAIDPDQTLQGNVYIRGDGDPCLGSGRGQNSLSWKTQIEAWADAVERLDIRKIEGDVIGDATKWEKALAAPGWLWEDLGNYYGAGASALSFHENSYQLIFQPGKKAGEAALILRTDPPLLGCTLHNEVVTGLEGSGDRACIYGSEFGSSQFIRGTVPAAIAEFAIKGAIPDPALACAKLLSQELEARGIRVEGKKREPSIKRNRIHRTLSPTIREIAYWTNQKSINLYAEHLLKQMGFACLGDGSTQAGIRAVIDFWKGEGIDLEGFHMVDGSGLARTNYITAKQLVQMLCLMRKSNRFEIFFESLPLIAKGIWAKSGSMRFIKCLAGYSERAIFALLINQCMDSKAIQDKIEAVFQRIR